MPCVAVIDIGSNSIKILVATRREDGSLLPMKMRTIDARISAGISRSAPRLSEEGMIRGMEAVLTLLTDAAAFSAGHVVMVATSAVRDAQNGPEFRERIRAATGHEIRILSGQEEATLIGRGLMCDPALRQLANFHVFDLGGGSLECLAFRESRLDQALSLRLGSVRLMEKFVPNPEAPLSTEEAQQISAHVSAELKRSGFACSLPPGSVAVGTGGSVTTVRAILGVREGRRFDDTSPRVRVDELRQLCAWLAALPLSERKKVPGLPAGRADIFPVALVTLLTLAELGGFEVFHNSVYNLRYGLADEALGEATEKS